jgi:hypothetical protein
MHVLAAQSYKRLPVEVNIPRDGRADFVSHKDVGSWQFHVVMTPDRDGSRRWYPGLLGFLIS